ncbi:MAG: hypothetical protein IKW97_05875 [Muribaculaceae bacterium]|nr:hypothetical protein [Muribaculaceae bacterium]
MKKTASLFFVLSLMLTSFTAGAQDLRGDVDYDGKVSIADVTTLIDYLLSGQWPEDVHEWVDLGLPSGTLWATCNVGASAPEDYGDYFAWGETAPKDYYDKSTYKWCNGSYNTLTKYCTNSSYGNDGFTDGKIELDSEDDAATVNWGENWRMPTNDQQQELIDNCTRTWTQCNGVNGTLVTGPNGNTIFLPAAGFRSCGLLGDASDFCYYWSRSLDSGHTFLACSLYFYSGYYYCDNFDRYYGFAVRPVRVSQN